MGLPIQLIQRMHEQVCSFEVLGAVPNAVGNDAIYIKKLEHCINTMNVFG